MFVHRVTLSVFLRQAEKAVCWGGLLKRVGLLDDTEIDYEECFGACSRTAWLRRACRTIFEQSSPTTVPL